MHTKKFIIRVLDTLLVIILAVLAYKLITEFGAFVTAFKKIARTFSPFFYGFLLAYVLNIPCNGISKLTARTNIPFLQKHKKEVSISVVYILLFLLIYVMLRMIIPAAYGNILLFARNFDRYYHTAEEFLKKLTDISPINLDLSIENLIPAMQNFSLDRLLSSVNAIVGVSTSIFQCFLALISSIYILIEKDKFKSFLHRVLKAFTPDAVYTRIIRYTDKLNMNFKQYIYAQTLDGCIIGTLVGIELAFLGSQFALILGIMLRILNYIPYFGSIIGTIAAVIISVTAGGAAAGMIGMLAAIPITATLLSILEDIITHFEEEKNVKEC